MKAKKFGLLAISAVALAMPFAASASFDGTVYVFDENGATAETNTFLGSLDGSIASALKDQWNVFYTATTSDSSTNPGGDYVSNLSFTVAPSVGTLGGSSDFTFTSSTTDTISVKLIDSTTSTVLTPTNFATLVTDGQYNFAGLISGHNYDWQVSFHVTASDPTFNTSFTVAAVPEPEEWAMMLVGAGLIGYQVRRKQKGLSQLEIA